MTVFVKLTEFGRSHPMVVRSVWLGFATMAATLLSLALGSPDWVQSPEILLDKVPPPYDPS